MTTLETPSGSLNYSSELEHFLARSKLVNNYYEKDFDISFSSLFLAFLANDDPLSIWFQTYVRSAGIDIQRIMEERGLNQQIIEEIANSKAPIQQIYRMTTSAQRYLQTADQFRRSMTALKDPQHLDVRHLMAVFIYRPWVHERDLMRWSFNREDWSNGFIGQIRSHWPDELSFWTEQHRKSFGKEPEE